MFIYIFIFLALVVVALIVTLIVVYKSSHGFANYMFNSSSYAPTKNGFSGVLINQLVQPYDFYKDKRDSTLNYLIAVYPQGANSLKMLDPTQLASFYNSLSWYYNCQFQYTDNDLGSYPGYLSNTWGALPCANDTPLPYPPQGYFYDFYSYQKNNVPVTYSNSKNHNLQSFGAGRPGLAFTTYITGQQGGIRPGPGAFWVNPRSIQRHSWSPNGPVSNKGIWNTISGQPVTWNYPNKWINGLPDNEYIEITHFYHGPGGVTTSPGYWYNACIGSGIFLSLGKSKRALCKIAMCLSLAQEVVSKLGATILQKFFQTTDPYLLIYNLQTFVNCDSTPTHCADIVPCCILGGSDMDKGIPREIGLSQLGFDDEIVRYQNQNGIPDSTPTYNGIVMAINAGATMSDYSLSRFGVNVLWDEPIFFMGVLLGYDTIQMPYDPNSSGFFVYEVIDIRLPSKYLSSIKNRDYSQMIVLQNSGPYNINMFTNPWNSQYLTDSLNYITNNKILTMRDPLDIFNNDKVLNCTEISTNKDVCPNNTQQPFKWYNTYGGKNKLSDAYKCLLIGVDDGYNLYCTFSGKNPTC